MFTGVRLTSVGTKADNKKSTISLELTVCVTEDVMKMKLNTAVLFTDFVALLKTSKQTQLNARLWPISCHAAAAVAVGELISSAGENPAVLAKYADFICDSRLVVTPEPIFPTIFLFVINSAAFINVGSL